MVEAAQEPKDAEAQRRPAHRRALGFLWRWLRRGALLLLLLALTVAALYLTRERTLHPLLVRFTPDLTRAFTPFEVSVAAIEGDWTGELKLTGVAVRPLEADGPLRQARVTTLVATGDLLRAARFADPTALTQVQVTAPVVQLDTTSLGEGGSEPEGATLPALPPFQITDGRLQVVTGADVIEVTGLEVQGSGDSGPLQVAGRASANAWAAAVRSSVRLDAGALRFEGDLLEGRVQDLELSADRLAGELRGSDLSLSDGRIQVGANRVSLDDVVLALGGPEGLTIGGLVRLDFPRLDELEATLRAVRGEAMDGPQTPAPSFFGAVRGTAALSPAPGQIATGALELTGEDIVVAGVRLGAVEAELLASDERLEVTGLRATDPGRVSIEGRGDLELTSRTLDDVTLSVRMEDPEVFLPGADFIGQLEVDLRLSGPIEAPVGAIRANAARLSIDGESVGSVAVEGTFEGGNLDVTRLNATTDHGELVAGGTVQLPLDGEELAVEVRTLSLSRGAAHMDLAGPTTVRFEGDGVQVEDVRLEGPLGALTVWAQTGGPQGVRAGATAEGFQVDAALDGMLEGSGRVGALDGEVFFQRFPLRAEVDATLSGARIAGVEEPVAARIDATWEEGVLELKEVTASLPHVTLDLSGRAPVDLGDAGSGPLGDGPVRLDAQLRVDADALRGDLLGAAIPEDLVETARRVSGAIAADLTLSGTWRALTGAGKANLLNVRYVDADGAPLPGLEDPVSGEIAVVIDDGVTLRPSALALGDLGVADGEVRIDRPLDVFELLDNPGAWLDAPLDASGRFACEGLGWIADLSPEIREAGGTLTFAGAAKGPLRSPTLDGRLTLTGGALRVRDVPTIKDLEFVLAATPSRIVIERASFSAGAAPVRLTGAVDLSSPAPTLDVRLQGDEVLLFRSEDAVVRSNIDLDLAGTPGALRLSGELALVGGRLRSPVEFQNILASGGSRTPEAVRRGLRLPSLGPDSVELDVRVTTADPMAIEGRLTRGQVRADLTLSGDLSHPIPSGQLFVDPLEVALPAGTLRFPTGLIRFDPADPDIPELELIGTTRLAGYDVTVEISGDYDQAVVDFSSYPPLVPDDLVMLVLSGRPPGTARGARAAGQTVALYVARDLVQGWFDSGGFDDSDRESFVDRLEVVSGRDVSRSGVLTVQATYRLREGLARERDAVYLVMERDSFEDYNVGLRLVLRLK